MDIAVLIAYNDPARGREMCRVLESIARSESFVCASCDLARLMDDASHLRPDIAIAEIPEAELVERTLRQLRRVSPGTRVLLAAEVASQDLVIGAIRGGAAGILEGIPDADDVAQALAVVQADGAWYDHELLYRTLHQCLSTPHAAAPSATGGENPLTAREEEILSLAGDGLSNKEIGRQLAISDATVKTHLHRIYMKLNRSGRYKAFLAQPGTTAPAPLPGLPPGRNSGWGPLT